MDVAHNLNEIKSTLKDNITLVAVSKTKPNKLVLDAYNAGHRDFGENKVQDLITKHESLPKDINWHFIGHLQSNKVKFIAPFIHLIHAADSLKLLRTINNEAQKNNRVIDVLLQIKIAKEDSKFGLDENDAIHILKSEEFNTFNNIKIRGLMGMATYTNDKLQIESEFTHLHNIYTEFKNLYFIDSTNFDTLSMGMSGDYKIALKCGSNMLRIGSTIFGERV